MSVNISTLTNNTDFLTPFQVKQIIHDYKKNVKPPVYPQGVTVTLNKYNAVEGETVTASATILPVGYDAKRVKSITWTASGNVNINPQNGIITARSAGTATITATVTYKPVSMDDNERKTVTGSATLNVSPATIYADYIVATLDNYSVTQGDTVQASAVVYPTDASNRSVTWRSSSPSIASIDSISGRITTNAAGNVYFIATAADGSGKTANTSNLQIAAKEIKVSSISVSLNPSSVTAGGTSQASATVYPFDASNRAVTWSIIPTSGASITQSGAISTTAQGNYTVTATAQDGSEKSGQAILEATTKPYEVSLATNSTFTNALRVRYLNDKFFVLQENGLVYRYDNDFTNEKRTSVIGGARDICVARDKLVLVGGSRTGTLQIAISDDNGDNWRKISTSNIIFTNVPSDRQNAFLYDPCTCVAYNPDDNILLACCGWRQDPDYNAYLHFMVSRDYGETWYASQQSVTRSFDFDTSPGSLTYFEGVFYASSGYLTPWVGTVIKYQLSVSSNNVVSYSFTQTGGNTQLAVYENTLYCATDDKLCVVYGPGSYYSFTNFTSYNGTSYLNYTLLEVSDNALIASGRYNGLSGWAYTLCNKYTGKQLSYGNAISDESFMSGNSTRSLAYGNGYFVLLTYDRLSCIKVN